ncbi:MAG TPA: hypothetical protein VMV81_14295 [Phycisphaerae bacterium]|nr:hypothetical protein [Phycisphaerae bacterium]
MNDSRHIRVVRRPPPRSGVEDPVVELPRPQEDSITLDRRTIKEKAFRLGIRKGCTPDFNLVWEWQRSQGFMTCFGASSDRCDRVCRWYEQCHELSQEPVDTPLPMPDFAALGRG